MTVTSENSNTEDVPESTGAVQLPACPLHGTPAQRVLSSGALLCVEPPWARHAWWADHDLEDDGADGCLCGMPVQFHRSVIDAGRGHAASHPMLR